VSRPARSSAAATALGAIAALASLAATAGCSSPAPTESARVLWNENCARCHGEDGHGTPALRGLEPRLDLSRSEIVLGGSTKLAYERIALGYRTMPGFAYRLDREEIEALVDYLPTLVKR
jgi:cytochrome c553